jgi:hypothetical protein
MTWICWDCGQEYERESCGTHLRLLTEKGIKHVWVCKDCYREDEE